MPRGSRDEPLTKLLYENGLFLHEDSRIGYDLRMTPHLWLAGEDMSQMRMRVLFRDNFRCIVCNRQMTEETAEVDHIVSRGKGGCDEMDNLQTLCHGCHAAKTLKSEHH
jgi:HNH endonuclease